MKGQQSRKEPHARPALPRPPRRPPLVRAALVFGPAAASAATADAGPEASGTGAAQSAPEPGTDIDSLLDRVEAVDTTRYGPALTPLLDTLPT
ncbi:hypothetical protein AB0D38_38740 [Streptomyces sp. NPDC048279]|uniref:hypothetical protein n=1 Tax=Streptomyces sp. NPDC048279 TaxID=3154714 RepID=UPI00342748F1